MVQILKEEIALKILDSARKEFFSHGYKDATVRNIAKGANIPVGLVYSYYKNKMTLFEKIVQPIYWNFGKLLTEKNVNKFDNNNTDDTLLKELAELLVVFEKNRKDVIILIDKSEGTKYENAKNEIIDMTTEHIQKNFLSKISKETTDIEPYFFHILAKNFIESIFEIGRNYKDANWAKKMLKLVAQQYFYGVNSL